MLDELIHVKMTDVPLSFSGLECSSASSQKYFGHDEVARDVEIKLCAY